MNCILKSLSVLLILTVCAASAVAADVPRLWEVKGRNRFGIEGKFYILPVTHNGLDAEYDDYFFRVVLPTALRADVFLQESALLVPAEIPPCPHPLPDTAENRKILEQAYMKVERAEYNREPHLPRTSVTTEQEWNELQEAEHWSAHDTVSKLTEYGLIAAMGEILNDFLEHHPELSQSVPYKSRPDIADYIEHQRLTRGIRSNESIDRSRDLVDAYCSIDPTRRGQYLRREIIRADPLNFRPMSAIKRATYNAEFVESMREVTFSGHFAKIDNDEFGKHAVCDRNEKWLAKMRDAVGGDVRFYALGMGHLMQRHPPSEIGCDGLLKRLRDEGFSVMLLK